MIRLWGYMIVIWTWLWWYLSYFVYFLIQTCQHMILVFFLLENVLYTWHVDKYVDRHVKIGFCFIDFKRINFDNQKFDGTKYVWFPKRKVIIISFVENVSFYLVSFWMFYDLTVRAIHRNCLSKATPSPPFGFPYSYSILSEVGIHLYWKNFYY